MTAASVVICTHDRGALAVRAARAAYAQAQACDAEVLVVDNASAAEAATALAALAADLGPRLSVVREATLGLSAARNRGLREAAGRVVVFLDDDAVPHPDWLAALLAGYEHPSVVCVGGPVRLAFPGAAPSWLTPPLLAAYSAFDLGPEPRRLRYRRDDYPYGANISFLAEAARAAGGFSSAVGPRGRRALVHDETDLCYRLDHAGGEIHYAPGAVVDHHVLPERLSPRWVLERHALGGRSAATFVLRNRPVTSALWRVWWRYRRALARRPYRLGEPVDPARLAGECERREALGYLRGLAADLPRLHRLRAEGRA
jgi:GT2 family glycosyltransferase